MQRMRFKVGTVVFAVLAAAFLMLVPKAALALNTPDGGGAAPVAAPIPKITVNSDYIKVPKSTANVSKGLANIMKLLMSLVGMLAIVFILIGGIQMAVSQGDPKRFQQARDTLLYAVVGLVLAIAAYAIVFFVTVHV